MPTIRTANCHAKLQRMTAALRHAEPDRVPGASYDYVVKLVREYGRYPLQLGTYDLPDLG